MKTNFQKTARTLGDFGAQLQDANRSVILLLGAAKSPVGLGLFIVIMLAFGSIAAAYGFADLMYVSRLQSEASNLGLEVTAKEVVAAAHAAAFWNGLPLMFVVSAFILLMDLVGKTNAAVAGACIEFLLGSAGFVYRAIDMQYDGVKFWAMIACGSVFIAAAPFYMHVAARYVAETFGKYISAVSERFNELLYADFEDLMK